MILEEIKNIRSEKSDLRKFGITIGIALCLLGGLLWWKGKDTYITFGIIAFIFILLGLIVPVLLKPLQKAWMTLAVILGWFMTRVILSILFYLIFTAIGLGSRLMGKEFLDLKMGDSGNSYWIKRPRKEFRKDDYERQY